MTTSPAPPRHLRRLVWRRRLVRHRRTAAAALTFVAVLVVLTTVRPSAPAPDQARGDVAVPVGMVLAPVHVADPAAATLVAAGDVVDVVVTAADGSARVVAVDARVVRVSGPAELLGRSDGGELLVAVVPDTGIELAQAAATGVVSVLLHP